MENTFLRIASTHFENLRKKKWLNYTTFSFFFFFSYLLCILYRLLHVCVCVLNPPLLRKRISPFTGPHRRGSCRWYRGGVGRQNMMTPHASFTQIQPDAITIDKHIRWVLLGLRVMQCATHVDINKLFVFFRFLNFVVAVKIKIKKWCKKNKTNKQKLAVVSFA